jgi:branched-chain amino acid transport system permease protein
MPTRTLVTRYEDDLLLFPDFWHKVGLCLGIIFLLGFPFVANDHWLSIGNLALIAVVGALGLMVLTGFTGQISLGHAAFLALGAYTVAVLGERFPIPFWICIPLAGLVAAGVGLAIGPFALRLEGLYLAIVTLGLLFLVAHFLLHSPDFTHGVSGMPVLIHAGFSASDDLPFGSFAEPTEVLGFTLNYFHKLYFVFLLITVLATLGVKNVHRSNTGRAMMAVRDHDLAAAVLGVDPSRTKILAFGLSSFIAGVAGAMFAYHQQYITVEPPFDLNMSVQYIAMVVLGGIGTVFGAVAGALTFVILSPVAEIVGGYLPWISTLSSAEQSTLLFALVVCAFLLFEPLGLFGIWLRVKRYFLAWPFRY